MKNYKKTVLRITHIWLPILILIIAMSSIIFLFIETMLNYEKTIEDFFENSSVILCTFCVVVFGITIFLPFRIAKFCQVILLFIVSVVIAFFSDPTNTTTCLMFLFLLLLVRTYMMFKKYFLLFTISVTILLVLITLYGNYLRNNLIYSVSPSIFIIITPLIYLIISYMRDQYLNSVIDFYEHFLEKNQVFIEIGKNSGSVLHNFSNTFSAFSMFINEINKINKTKLNMTEQNECSIGLSEAAHQINEVLKNMSIMIHDGTSNKLELRNPMDIFNNYIFILKTNSNFKYNVEVELKKRGIFYSKIPVNAIMQVIQNITKNSFEAILEKKEILKKQVELTKNEKIKEKLNFIITKKGKIKCITSNKDNSISIIDTGCGIKECSHCYHEKSCNECYNFSTGKTTKEYGTGQGMESVIKILNKFNYKLEIFSYLNFGTMIKIYFGESTYDSK